MLIVIDVFTLLVTLAVSDFAIAVIELIDKTTTCLRGALTLGGTGALIDVETVISTTAGWDEVLRAGNHLRVPLEGQPGDGH